MANGECMSRPSLSLVAQAKQRCELSCTEENESSTLLTKPDEIAIPSQEDWAEPLHVVICICAQNSFGTWLSHATVM